MAKRKARVVLICEDRQQSTFAREYLRLAGFVTNSKKMRVEICPSGRGSGEQFVREQFVEQVALFRNRASYSSGGEVLVFVIDADTQSVEYHQRALHDLLVKKGFPGRTPKEKIALFVPKRNIETWIHYAQGTDVNEADAYRKLERERACKPYVKHLKENICTKPLPENAPPSLFTACEELNRIL